MFTQYLEQAVLNHIFGKTAYAEPTIYVGLSTADPAYNGSGLAEPSGNGYARVAVPAASWNAATGGNPATITNASQITFPQATGSWGTVTYGCIFDAATGGNLLASGALAVAQVIGSGNTADFAASTFAVTLQ